MNRRYCESIWLLWSFLKVYYFKLIEFKRNERLIRNLFTLNSGILVVPFYSFLKCFELLIHGSKYSDIFPIKLIVSNHINDLFNNFFVLLSFTIKNM